MHICNLKQQRVKAGESFTLYPVEGGREGGRWGCVARPFGVAWCYGRVTVDELFDIYGCSIKVHNKDVSCMRLKTACMTSTIHHNCKQKQTMT